MILRLDPTLYVADAVSLALAAFAAHADVSLDSSEPGTIRVNIDSDDQTIDEFLNYALTASLEHHLDKH